MPISSTISERSPTPRIGAQGAASAPLKATLKSRYDKLAFGLAVRAEFYTTMADFADAGVAPYAGIQEMLGVARDRLSKRSLVKVYADVLETLKTGAGLPSALAPWIPASEIAMLHGAEQAGPAVLNATFAELGSLLVRQGKARAKLLSVLGMNLGNLTVVFGVMIMVINTLVPVLDKIVTPALAAKMQFAMVYFGTSEWLIHNGFYLLFGLIGLAGYFTWALPNWASPRRRIWDQYIPPFSVYQRLQATLFLSTTASMMRAGITLNNVLKDLGQFSSKWMRYHVDNMQAVLKKGDGEVKALAVGPLPNNTADTLRYYRLIPRFQDVMTRLSEANFTAYEKSVDRIASVLALTSALLTTAFGVATTIAMFNFSDALQASASTVQQAVGG